jgi:hypothetical protein
MKNILFFSLLISASAYGMGDKINDFSDSEVVAVERFENRSIIKYLASLRNGDRVCGCFDKGLFQSSRTPAENVKKVLSGKPIENVIRVYCDSTLYFRLEKLYKERNSSQEKQVASTSAVDSEN